MKKTATSIITIVVISIGSYAQINTGIGTTTPDVSAKLDVVSTTQGFVMPRMTTTQRLAITSPIAGLEVYDTTTGSHWYHNGFVWVENVTGSGNVDFTDDEWVNNPGANRIELGLQSDGTTARTARTEFTALDNGNVGIGTATPSGKLHLLSVMSGSLEANLVLTDAGPGGDSAALSALTGGLGLWADFISLNAGNNPDLYIATDPTISSVSNVGIGTITPTERLEVNGNIYASGGGDLLTDDSIYADYVFEDYVEGTSTINKDYNFKTLEEIDSFIKINKHLPGVTGINELQKTENGYVVNISALSGQLLEKVEELYLHTISQQKQLNAKNTEINQLKTRLAKIEAALGLEKE